jgi:ADP-heptose:LPS heptosyltransferase
VNYQERTHDLAGVPYEFSPRFYPTEEERKEAVAFRATLGEKGSTFTAPAVLWAIGGSSNHKLYPFTHIVTAWVIKQTNAHVIFATGPDLIDIEHGLMFALEKHGCDMTRVHRTGGEWGIRRALTFTEYADVVVGPETGLINAASHLDTPTVVMLSHSSPENLTKHWRNTIVLHADPRVVQCYPCHRLHLDWTYCPQVEETSAALCASSIKPELVFQAVRHALGMRAWDGCEQSDVPAAAD